MQDEKELKIGAHRTNPPAPQWVRSTIPVVAQRLPQGSSPSALTSVNVQSQATVTPFIEAEYKVVLLEHQLDPHLGSKEAKSPTDPTYVEVWLQEKAAPAIGASRDPYTGGGKLKRGNANLAVFTDEACAKPLAFDGAGSAALTHAQLTQEKRLRLYLKGKAAGKVTLTLELDPATSKTIKVAPPAKQELGVVKLALELYKYDNTQSPPALAKLSDKSKVQQSRCVHVQNSAKEHGRAKLVLKKLEAAQWPEGCDKYEIVLNFKDVRAGGAGAVEFFQAEKGGAGQATLKFAKAALDAADQEVWVEGKAVTEGLREIRVDAGLDRPTDAHAPAEKTAKRNGDWAPLSVVEIEKVAPSAEFAAPSDKYKQDKYRQYVNLPADGGDLTRGRELKLKAGLTKKLEGVEIYFRLVPPDADPKNRETLPADLKHVDEVAGPPKTNVPAKTEAGGVAEAKVTLSRFGGDLFEAGAYLADDPILGRAKPAKSKKIAVWRKVWHQITADAGATLPSRASNATAFEKAFLEVEDADNKIITYKTDVAGLTYHPLWQFKPDLRADAKGDREIVCVGDHNKAKFYALYQAPDAKHKPKAHMIMCDVQWDPQAGPLDTYNLEGKSAVLDQWNATKNKTLGVFDPPLKGGNLVQTGMWKWNDGAKTHTGTLADANLKVEKTREYYSRFKVTLPAKCAAGVCTGCAGGTDIAPTAAKKAEVKLQLNCAAGPWAGESGQPGSPQCLIVVNPDTNKFNHTIAHEIGHLFKQVRKDNGWLNVPDHSDQYEKRGGQGSHCKKGATEHPTAKDQDGATVYTGGTCIMFHVAVGNTLFCDQCQLDLQIRDVSDFFK